MSHEGPSLLAPGFNEAAFLTSFNPNDHNDRDDPSEEGGSVTGKTCSAVTETIYALPQSHFMRHAIRQLQHYQLVSFIISVE